MCVFELFPPGCNQWLGFGASNNRIPVPQGFPTYESSPPNNIGYLSLIFPMLILNLPTNIYKSSNNKKYQQISTNLPTI